MIKIPYGISNFETLRNRGQHYMDRTMFIEKIEHYYSSYLFFLRPRKFGKSLFLSMLDYYYNRRHKDKFEDLFGQYYIGKNPTKLANQYLVLKLDFSQIQTSNFEDTFSGFLNNVKVGAMAFYGEHPDFFDKKDIERVRSYDSPIAIVQDVILETSLRTPHKIYLLIDEYDHFANEILSFRFDEFLDIVGRNGFVRKFYEAIKVGTQQGVIDRFFVTGVSPIMLDSIRSSLNVSTNISLEKEFNSMLGFEESEIVKMLNITKISKEKLDTLLSDMKMWYDGYKFSIDTEKRVYNSSMILYFLTEYSFNGKYPKNLLDPNIISDYNEIRKIFKIKGKEKGNFKYLQTLLQTGELHSYLVNLHDLENHFTVSDVINFLHHKGFLTIKESRLDSVTFQIPNYSIEQLYFQYFHQVILETAYELV